MAGLDEKRAWLSKVGGPPAAASASGAPGGTPTGAPAGAPPGAPGGGPGGPPAQAPVTAPLGAKPSTNIVTDGAVSPTTPFTVTPAVMVEVEKIAIGLLRPIVIGMANKAFSAYLSSIDQVSGALDKAEKDENDANAAVATVVISVALLAAGPALGAAAAAAATKVNGLDATLRGQIETQGPRLAKLAGMTDDNAISAITAAAYSDFSNSALSRLITEFNADKAKAAIDKGTAALSGQAVKLTQHPDKWANGHAFLDALKTTADGSISKLIPIIGTTNDFSGLVGLFKSFEAGTPDFYKTTIRQQADHFMAQLAPPMAAAQSHKGHEMLVKMNAYGRMRYARVLIDAEPGLLGSGVTYVFRAWVTPDMEPMAAQTNPTEINPKDIEGHLPAPEEEANKARVVRMDAWGKLRLAIVSVADDGIVKVDYGKMTFVRWVADSETAQAEAQGASQNGGINTVDPGKVAGLKAPPEPPKT